MPGDVAVEGPRAGVGGLVLDHDIAVRLQELHVPPLRVGSVDDGCAVPVPRALVQHIEVVAVQVHGVGGSGGVLDDEAYAAVAAGVVDVPFRGGGVGGVAGFGEEEEGAVVVGAEGGVVHRPDEVAGGVYRGADFEGDGCAGVWRRGYWVVGYCVC